MVSPSHWTSKNYSEAISKLATKERKDHKEARFLCVLLPRVDDAVLSWRFLFQVSASVWRLRFMADFRAGWRASARRLAMVLLPAQLVARQRSLGFEVPPWRATERAVATPETN